MGTDSVRSSSKCGIVERDGMGWDTGTGIITIVCSLGPFAEILPPQGFLSKVSWGS